MAHWLFKSEAGTWSWDDQVKSGAKGEPWTGVRNHQANNNMKAMRKGERGFFYHSGDEKRIVGIVEIVREHYPDGTDESGRFGMVDLRAIEALAKPVTLAEIKAEERLAEMVLVKNSRLSVQPVTEAEWAVVMALAAKPD